MNVSCSIKPVNKTYIIGRVGTLKTKIGIRYTWSYRPVSRITMLSYVKVQNFVMIFTVKINGKLFRNRNIFEDCVSYTMKTILVISVCAECLFICAEFSDKRKLDRKSSGGRPRSRFMTIFRRSIEDRRKFPSAVVRITPFSQNSEEVYSDRRNCHVGQ